MSQSRYILSFTAASLRLNEMVKTAKIAAEEGLLNLDKVLEKNEIFSAVKKRTSDREFREIQKRLEKLTEKQLSILAHGDLISQKQIAFLAVCKYYTFIRDFTVEVLRDKALLFDYQLNESDINSFINSKILSHPELEKFSQSTLKKAKQVMFLIFEQAGIINDTKDKIIQPQILSQEVIKAIIADETFWLKIFMISDLDVEQLSR